MITLEHSAVTLLKLKGKEDEFKKSIPFILEPDAIRRYTGPRPYSHFEKNGNDVSWMEFPKIEELKVINKDNIFNYSKAHFAGEYPKCVIGEETQIDVFEKHNSHLEELNFKGIKNHLIQDVDFDIFVREIFDCTKRYEDKFKFNGLEIDGKEMRKLVQKLSEFGLYRLAYLNYMDSATLINQKWYDKNVYEPLLEIYSKDLADGTYNYMKIPEQIDEWITNRDWNHFDEAPISVNRYDELYCNVIQRML